MFLNKGLKLEGFPEEDIHDKKIAVWEKKVSVDLSLEQHAQLLEMAIHAIAKRALVTLSSITLMVILDRVLHQSIEKYSMLSEVKLENRTMNFQEFNRHLKNHNPEDLLAALRYLLAEQLRVLGRITADILTEPLHQELLKVKWKQPEQP